MAIKDTMLPFMCGHLVWQKPLPLSAWSWSPSTICRQRGTRNWNKICTKGSIQTMAIKETTPTHTLGTPLHDCMHPPCCLSCVDTWFDKSLCHSPLGHDHHLQTAGKEEAGIGINLHQKKHPNNGHQGNHSNLHFRNAIAWLHAPTMLPFMWGHLVWQKPLPLSAWSWSPSTNCRQRGTRNWNKICTKGSIQTMAIKETTPTHTLGMPLHDCMHPPCCLSCVDTWFGKSLCHSPLDHDHHLQTAGKEEAGIGIKFARKEASKQWPSRKPLQPTL